MTHDALINRLVENLKPVQRRRPGVDLLIVAAICATELALFLALGAARPDLPIMMRQPTVLWRLASLGLIALIGGVLAILSFYPTYAPKRGIRWLALIVAICLAFGLSLNAGSYEIATVWQRLDWAHGLQCVTKMVLLSLPAVIGLGVLMRRGAPTDTRGTAFLVGLAAAAWGAFVFVFACPSDDPLYISVWYSVGCGIVVLSSRLILPRLARW